MVVDGGEVLGEGLGGGGPGGGIAQAKAGDGVLGVAGALRGGGHAAISDACFGHATVLDPETERAEQGGDVLVEALRDLVAAEVFAPAEPRHDDAGEDLAGGTVLAAVAEEEVFERQHPACVPVAQLDGGAEGDQHRR